MIDWDRELTDDRQAGMLQQIVDIIDATGAGIFDRNDRVVGLAGFHLVKDIGKFCAAALDELFEMARRVLAGGQM